MKAGGAVLPLRDVLHPAIRSQVAQFSRGETGEIGEIGEIAVTRLGVFAFTFNRLGNGTWVAHRRA
jgi:hypothetical protein